MTILKTRFYLIMLAGMAGGLAEMVWIGVYSTVTHTAGADILRQITATLFPAWTHPALAPVLGVGIHLALSLVLAFLCYEMCIKPVARRYGSAAILLGSMMVLAMVWAINFLVILPVINPAFVTLLPFLVTLVSKMLFGIAMGAVFSAGIRFPTS